MANYQGANVGALGAGLGLLDAVAEKNGQAAPGQELSAEMNSIASDVAAMIEPVVSDVISWSLSRFGLAGVALDKNEPFSDASLSAALSAALGVQVSSVKNREQLKDGFRRAVTFHASQQTGVNFQNVFDPVALKHDVLVAAGAHVGDFVPGLNLRDLSDRMTTVDDVSAYGLNLLSQSVGISFGDNLKNAAAIREAIYAWAMPIVQARVDQERAEGTPYSGRLKMDRKSVLNRMAQRRFRERWRGLRKYQGVNDGQ